MLRLTKKVKKFTLKPKYVNIGQYSTIMGNEEVHGRFVSLVRAFRYYGHFEASLDPLDINKPEIRKELHPGVYGFKVINNEVYFDCDGVISMGGKNPKRYANLMEILEHLRNVYCGNVGSMFMHLDTREQNWIANELESSIHSSMLPTEEKEAYFLKLLQESEIFDNFLAKKFPQVKRYGLEGSESMMIAIDSLFETISKSKIETLVIGMPHRGRLNFLNGILGFPPRAMFHKIKGNSEFPEGIHGSGDVLSHLGISTILPQYGNLKISLLNNPSHLEAVNPVAMGKTKAKLKEGQKASCFLIHGDTAFTGQGIVSESLGLANLPHFKTDGTIHMILNNQLGFTTPSKHARSSRYSADVGKMIGTPIFIVNGENLTDVERIMKIAVRYKLKFKKDVIVEIMNYRKHGHNELDEPSFTQPFMYKVIRSKESIAQKTKRDLIDRGIVTEKDYQIFHDAVNKKLEDEFKESNDYLPGQVFFQGKWKDIQFSGFNVSHNPDTGYSVSKLEEIGLQSVSYPKHFEIHERLLKYHISTRRKMIEEGNPVDWATAEAMAIGTLIVDGIDVRLCGQDVGRGTFSQRHLRLSNQQTDEKYEPLSDIKGRKGELEIVPSPLSELAVLGFEYGYTIDNPKNLSIWEAQFGDFSLNAMAIIDQFITCGEDKWAIQSSLVMLLPHGFDGAGPEHSSARIERYLQLCDGEINSEEEEQKNCNMFVVNCTTPANYFHVLRRQMVNNYRKPLIVFSPKTLLRHSKAVSPLSDFSEGTQFQPILTEENNSSGIDQILICSGKLYYELTEERKKKNLEHSTTIIRIEQFSPFPYKQLKEELSKYQNAKVIKYVQEEPENMGGYIYVKTRFERFENEFGMKLKYAGRKPLSSPAVGISKVHKKELAKLYEDAFTF